MTDTLNLYSGIFLREPGQTLLAASLEQVDQTLGAAYNMSQAKQNSDEVFIKCLGVVEGCNDAFFEEEANMVFLKIKQSSDCLRTCFIDFGKQMIRENPSQVQLRITIPSETTFVKLLLLAALQKSFVSSGAFFRGSSIEKKDATMDCIRSAFASMRDDYILEEPLQQPEVAVPRAVDSDDVDPDDSVSNVESKRSHKSSATSRRSGSEESSSSAEHDALTHKSVTMASRRQ